MRLASYEHNRRPGVGVLREDRLVPVVGIDELGRQTSIELLGQLRLDEEHPVAVTDVRLRPVIPAPDKVICVGLNYREHVAESQRKLPTYPVLFCKFASCLIGAGDQIPVPPESTQVDYEGELAVVIGRAVRRASAEDAARAILGYCVANDVTLRDYQYKTHQWLQGKTWEATTPLGPFLVTPDELPDGPLRVRTILNGEVVQDSDTSKLIFDIPTLISTISQFTTLLPGDVILTGTPGGVGFRREPQRFLVPGDEISVEVAGVGRLTNAVVEEVPRIHGDSDRQEAHIGV
jgi:acylpyruvate hydrolase